MQIIEQSLTRLKIQHRSVTPGIISGTFVFVGLLAILIFYQLTTFTCQRIQGNLGNCQLINTNVLGTTIKEIPLQSIQEVTLEENQSEELTYRVTLLTKEEKIPLTYIFTSELELYENMISNIKIFQKNSNQSNLMIQKNDESIIIIAIILMVIGIVLFLFFANLIIFEFDKKLDLIKIEKKRFFQTEVNQYRLQDILGVNWEGTKGNHSNRIMLILASGKQIALINDSLVFNKQKDNQIIRRIYQFLKVDSAS